MIGLLAVCAAQIRVGDLVVWHSPSGVYMGRGTVVEVNPPGAHRASRAWHLAGMAHRARGDVVRVDIEGEPGTRDVIAEHVSLA